jgi:branched-chain amino acid transport system substrate-binding protein
MQRKSRKSDVPIDMTTMTFRGILMHCTGILLVAISYAVAAPSSKTSTRERSPSASPIVLGVSSDQSGPVAGLGTGLLAGSNAYFQVVNGNGGVNGRRIQLVVMDDHYDPETAVANTQNLIARHNAFCLFDYVGTPTLTRVLPLLKFHEQESIVNLGPLTGADPQRRPPYDKYVFSLRASYRQETASLVGYLYTTGCRKIGLFLQSDAYGMSGQVGVVEALARRGLHPVAAATYRRGQPLAASMQKQVDLLRAKSADAVIAIGTHAPCAAFIRDARVAGWNVPIANVSFVDAEQMLKELIISSRESSRDLTSNLINSQVVPSPDLSRSPAVAEYRSHIQSDKVGFASFEGWINAAIATEALRRTGPMVTRERFIEALESLTNWDPGVGSPLAFSKVHHQGWDRVWLMRTELKRWVPAETPSE